MSIRKRVSGAGLRFAALAGVLAAAVALTTALPTPADAGAKKRFGVYKGPGGKGTWQHRKYKRPGKSHGITTWQNRNGYGRRDTWKRWDKDRGYGQRFTKTKRPGGGWSASKRNVKRTGDGTYATRGWYGNSKGRGVRYKGSGARTDSGWAESGAYKRRNGGTGTYDRSFERGEGGFNRSLDVTTSGGKTYGKDVAVTRDGRKFTREVTYTGPGGQSKTKTWQGKGWRW